MIKGVDKTVEWIRLNKLVRFAIKTSGGDNNNIFKTGDSETFEDSIKRFREVMSISFAGKFIIEGSQENNKSVTRGLFREEFSNFEGYPEMYGSPQQAQVGAISIGEVEQKIEQALDKDRKERRLQELETENKELQKELKERDTPFNNFLGTILPHATEIISKITTVPKTAVSIGEVAIDEGKLEETETEQVDATEVERLQTALIQWAEFEENISSIIEGIVKLHKENPSQYEIAKKMLI